MVTSDFSNETPVKTVSFDEIPANEMGLDIGPKTLDKYRMSIGFDYDFSKIYTLRFFFLHETKVADEIVEDKTQENTFNLSYRFNL